MMLQVRSVCVVVSSYPRIGVHRPLGPGYREPFMATLSELALGVVGRGAEVRGGVTWPHTWGEALGVHIGDLLSNLQGGALP